jgi:hypothetical protein
MVSVELCAPAGSLSEVVVRDTTLEQEAPRRGDSYRWPPAERKSAGKPHGIPSSIWSVMGQPSAGYAPERDALEALWGGCVSWGRARADLPEMKT